ncbi:MAG: peptidylprolyl isomerase [Polyangiaceae bacterium]
MTSALLLPFAACKESADAPASPGSAAPSASSGDAGVAVLTLGANRVTEPALAARLADYGPTFRPSVDSVKTIAQTMLDDEILVHEAEAQGLLADGKIARRAEEYRRQLVVSELLASHAKKPEEWTPEEVATFYAQNRVLFGKPERVHVRRIPFSLSDRKTAEVALAEAKKGTSFDALVAKYVIDPVAKARGGDVDPYGRGTMTTVGDGPFDLKRPGDVALFETTFGVSLVLLVEKLPADVVDPASKEIDRQIRLTMSTRERDRWKQELLGRTRDAAAPVFDEERVRALAAPSTPPHDR